MTVQKEKDFGLGSLVHRAWLRPLSGFRSSVMARMGAPWCTPVQSRPGVPAGRARQRFETMHTHTVVE